MQGAWRCYFSVTLPYENIAHDASHYTISENWLSIVEGSKIYRFNYPCQYDGVSAYNIKSDSLFVGEPLRFSEKIIRKNDSTLMSYYRYDAKNHVATILWQRADVDMGIIEQLRRDSLNYKCLELCFELKTVYDSYYGDGGGPIYFPLPLPRYVCIPDVDSARRIDQTRQLWLTIMGRKCLFNVTSLDWIENNGSLYNYPVMEIVPADWWQGKDFDAKYESIENNLSVAFAVDLRTGRKKIPRNDSFVTSEYNILFWEIPACKQVKNPIITELAAKAKQQDYIDDPFWAQQLPMYFGIKGLLPLQSGKSYYYSLKPHKHPIFHPTNNPDAQDLDFAPLRKASSLVCYFARGKNEVLRNGSYDDFCIEVWEFADEQAAKTAKAFFEVYDALPRYEYEPQYYYNLSYLSVAKGKYVYHLSSRTNNWEMDEILKKMAK